MKKTVLIASLIAVAALTACGKKDEPPPAVVAPPAVVVTPPAAPAPTPAPAATPSPDAQSALDAANAATEAAKKNAETPPAKP